VPKIRRKDLPPALFQHLLDRIQSRRISTDQLVLLARWLDAEPDVPESEWYRRFPGFTICGEGELIKTLLLPGQHPKGQRVE
jgi:ribosomal protein S18 acetylase RimI-like enzyme